MNSDHHLGATVSDAGVAVVLHCPYDTGSPAGLQDYPDWMVPPCRPNREARCAAAEQVAAGGVAVLWGGPPTPLASGMRVQLWRDDAGLHLAAASAGPPTVEDIARHLARVSRSDRYAGNNWHLLLTAEANVEHAWKEASRLGCDQVTVDSWRAMLHNWYWDARNNTAQTAATVTPS